MNCAFWSGQNYFFLRTQITIKIDCMASVTTYILLKIILMITFSFIKSCKWFKCCYYWILLTKAKSNFININQNRENVQKITIFHDFMFFFDQYSVFNDQNGTLECKQTFPFCLHSKMRCKQTLELLHIPLNHNNKLNTFRS